MAPSRVAYREGLNADADEADFQAELHRTRDMMARAQAGCYGSVPPRAPARDFRPSASMTISKLRASRSLGRGGYDPPSARSTYRAN